MWQQIRANRRRSAFVIAGMGVLLLAVGAGLGVLFGGGSGPALAVGAGIALVVWLLLWWSSARGGDDVMLRMANAREVRKEDLPQLVNVVEEMSIAAALDRTPRVFVVDDPAPNAFATGRNPDKAAVTVTTGLLAMLDRDELQGVVAHEIGHVKNRDVALMVTAGIMLGSIVLLADLGARALWFGGGRRSRSSQNGGGGAAVVIVAVVAVILAPLLAQLFYFALSRRREYLADASGAMYTRYPEGLARALEKISGSTVAQADQSRVTAPMYIVRPVRAAHASASARRRRRGSWFSTHPPPEERVRILRAMGGGAGLADYLEAYRSETGDALLRDDAGAGREPARHAAGTQGTGAAALTGAGAGPAVGARAASDALLRGSGYVWRPCASCGATAKVPPAVEGLVQRCPRCRAPYPKSTS